MTAQKWRAGCAHGCDWLGPWRTDPAVAADDGREHCFTVVLHEQTEAQ